MNPLALFVLFVTGGAIAAVVTRRAQSQPAVYAADIDDADVAGSFAAAEPAAPVAAGFPAVEAPDIFQTVTAAVSNTLKKIFTVPAAGQQYADAIRAAEVKYSLPDGLLARTLYQESRFRPEIINGSVRSSAGAIGIAQFMPGTARDLGVDPLNPWQSIDGAARYLRQHFNKFGSWDQALAAYNWGQGNQAKDLRDGIVGNQWPTETRNYVAQILADVDV